jgi:hypothetical protein
VMSVGIITLIVLRNTIGEAAPWIIGGLVAVWVVLHVWLSRGRPQVDPASAMEHRAPTLARLLPSSFVVMGHTHVPVTKTLGDAHYVNLGSWAEEEPDPGEDPTKVYRAARTHLVIHAKEGRHEAHLNEWRTGEGPKVVTSLIRPLPGASSKEEGASSAVAE